VVVVVVGAKVVVVVGGFAVVVVGGLVVVVVAGRVVVVVVGRRVVVVVGGRVVVVVRKGGKIAAPACDIVGTMMATATTPTMASIVNPRAVARLGFPRFWLLDMPTLSC
jgi:hypothetical protein